MNRASSFFLVVANIALWQTGCGSASKPAEKAPGSAAGTAKVDPEKDHESHHGGGGHSHEPQHGGMVQSVGENHLELVHDARNGELTVYVLGNEEHAAYPIESKPLTAQVKQQDDEDLLSLELNPIPLEGEGKGRSSRFAGTESRLVGQKPFEAVLRVKIDEKIFRAVFQVVPGETRQAFVCAMGCENGKVYSSPGKCPICHMDLVQPKAAHADHNPRHGGILFMAPNRWHHLEGVMPTAHSFHLYFYNNFVKPIPAKPFAEGSNIEVVQMNAELREVGASVKVALSTDGDADYLRASIPEGMRFPLSITARVRFEGREKPELFNFSFKNTSKEGQHDH